MRISLILLAVLGVVAAVPQPAPDIAIVNARVFTGIRTAPWAEAVSIRGERIAAVGSTTAIRAGIDASTRVIDAEGKLVVPGINDAHAHVAASPPAIDLAGPPAVEHDPSLPEVLDRIRAVIGSTTAAAATKTVARSGSAESPWITGEIGALVLEDPAATRATLDRVTGDHPLILGSWTGHGALLNSAGFKRLGVREDEPDPPGGFFTRAANGTLTGRVDEYAGFMLGQRLSMLPGPDAQVAAFREYAKRAAALGITTVQVMSNGYPAAKLAGLLKGAELPVRFRLIEFPMETMAAWRPPTHIPEAGRVTVSGTKWILDGTPIERLMLLRQPYSDAPQSHGRADFTPESLRTFLSRALEAHQQPILHAVGDGTIANVLDALEATGGERWKPLRPRIEHGDMFDPRDLGRAKLLGLVIVQNPSHFMIAPLMAARLGKERAAGTQQVRTIVAGGVPFALGSDGPMNPYLNMMFAAMNPMNPAQALSVEQSLAAYTEGSAFAEMQETAKGTIAPGMLADITILSQDIATIPLQALPATTSVLTIVGGKIVYSR